MPVAELAVVPGQLWPVLAVQQPVVAVPFGVERVVVLEVSAAVAAAVVAVAVESAACGCIAFVLC